MKTLIGIFSAYLFLFTDIGVLLVLGVLLLLYKFINKSRRRKREKEYKKSRNKYEQEIRKREQEEFIRKTSICNFEDGISYKQFRSIIITTCKPIKRLVNYEIDGLILRGTVITQSGISKWNFEIDFNDYGHLTGNYWLKSENYDSKIPNVIAENIKSYIETNNIPND